ncbi:hypothetical protein [Meiothermus luteus]|uniref:hypothetical protein n=1 Tax=Meiothermus luteus TaxID=2026184 RepID=UPI0038B396E6
MGEQGGPRLNQNAFGVDLSSPQPALAGLSYTETMHAITVGKDGRQYHVAIAPAKESPINRGDYSIRGGTNALTVWSPTGSSLPTPTSPPPATRSSARASTSARKSSPGPWARAGSPAPSRKVFRRPWPFSTTTPTPSSWWSRTST